MKNFIPIVVLAIGILSGCGTSRKISYLKDNGIGVSISPTFNESVPEITNNIRKRDTLKVQDPNGNEVIIMKAIRDEDGEMVATEQLEAATVTAKFRNVAERHGVVDITFLVTVPQFMQDSKWQIRLSPLMKILDEETELDPVIITGTEFRKKQIRGYDFYRRFLSSIISDSDLLIHQVQLDHFIERTLPELYRFKSDSSVVDSPESLMSSPWGVTQKEALEHFKKDHLIRHNDRKKREKMKMYEKYVKVPIITDGIRLDTVITSASGDFIYEYVQRINTRPSLRKVDIILSGSIYEQDTKVWTIPQSEPLAFYISSISSLTDDNVRFLTKVVSRKVEANTESLIAFRSGKYSVEETLGTNSEEISRIKQTLRSIIENQSYDLDSIQVVASCSPEGKYSSNKVLSQKRSESVSRYFEKFIKEQRDSLHNELSRMVVLDEEFSAPMKDDTPIRFISRSNPENWDRLTQLIQKDSTLTMAQKESYKDILQIANPDNREDLLRQKDYYKYLFDNIYPSLRSVKFNFYLHRKGMVQDTLQTTVVDSVYMAGVQAIRDRDYEKAITILRPYNDFNTAVAYSCMDYNASALDVLTTLERNDESTEYMFSVLYARLGQIDKAVQCYLNACRMNPVMIHRGNLDPEISALIQQYDIHLYDNEDDFIY